MAVRDTSSTIKGDEHGASVVLPGRIGEATVTLKEKFSK